MQFDFEQFTKRFKRAYPVARYGRRKQNDGNDCDLFSYDEALEVFREYFLAYEYYTGTAHPQLKREKIIDILFNLDLVFHNAIPSCAANSSRLMLSCLSGKSSFR